MSDPEARRLRLVSELTEAIGHEIDSHQPDDSIGWAELPTVGAMVQHVGIVHRWVAAVVRSRSAVDRRSIAGAPGQDLAAWFREGRGLLLDALAEVPAGDSCWILGRSAGTAGFWHRRMFFENAKHLMDLRAAGGRPWVAAPELDAEDYADGIDELFEVFLPRSRRTLPVLPAPVVLRAEDVARAWRIARDWSITSPGGEQDDAATTTVRARAGDLALALWERADLGDEQRFTTTGEQASIDVLRREPIHPW